MAPSSRFLRDPVGALRPGVKGHGFGGGDPGLTFDPSQPPGPFVTLLPVRDPAEGVALTLTLPRISAASVWAQDITVALDTAER